MNHGDEMTGRTPYRYYDELSAPKLHIFLKESSGCPIKTHPQPVVRESQSLSIAQLIQGPHSLRSLIAPSFPSDTPPVPSHSHYLSPTQSSLPKHHPRRRSRTGADWSSRERAHTPDDPLRTQLVAPGCSCIAIHRSRGGTRGYRRCRWRN